MNATISKAARIATALLLFAAGTTRAADAAGPPPGIWEAHQGEALVAFEFQPTGSVRMMLLMDDQMRAALPNLPADKRANIEKMKATVHGQDWIVVPGTWTPVAADRVHVHIDRAGSAPLDSDFTFRLDGKDALVGKFAMDPDPVTYQRLAP